MTRALVLIGAPGAGKSSALEKLTTALQIAGVPHGALESEELARGWPWLEADAWTAQLSTVLALQRSAGRDLFLVVATPETDAELRAVVAATGADAVLVVCLVAAPQTVAARVLAREPDDWPDTPWLARHAGELAETIPWLAGIDVVLSSEQADPRTLAQQLVTLMRERDLIA